MPRPGQRLKKHALWQKRRSPPRVPAPDPSASNSLHAYAAAYLEWSRVMGYREQGVVMRDKALRRFIRWCDERGLSSPGEITLPILERYQRHLYQVRKADGQPLAFTSQQALLVPLKGWFKWLTRSRHTLTNPASELMLPRTPLRLPMHVLTVAEVDHLINQADVSHISGIRDRAILETLYSTGLRRMELASLAVYDWSRAQGALSVRQGKGGRDRVVPIGERAAAWLTRYADEVRPQLVIEPDDGALFLTDYGEAFGKNRLGDMVRRHLDYAGITTPGSCHLLRHACATHMLENGADIRFIQALLGHADLNSTQIYTQVSITKLKQIHAATHPARLRRDRGDPAQRVANPWRRGANASGDVSGRW
ncbi:site-specific tyrosine recombinase XerC [Propionivibrio sp.]|uniref:site-specific tyrosine recombinase XerC n=1 Tax=Propionivibrio sp. TaxID=2212460 RepID=UPI002625CE2D|nr:site-specific tyrosine recombinase XerC [Propionivibrio sp.]